jgi:hypothetical protein
MPRLTGDWFSIAFPVDRNPEIANTTMPRKMTPRTAVMMTLPALMNCQRTLLTTCARLHRQYPAPSSSPRPPSSRGIRPLGVKEGPVLHGCTPSVGLLPTYCFGGRLGPLPCLPWPRSATGSACPGVPAVRPGSPSCRARNGHGDRLYMRSQVILMPRVVLRAVTWTASWRSTLPRHR